MVDEDYFFYNSTTSMHIIGSEFKAWLRELPSEIFPESVQDKMATGSQCPCGKAIVEEARAVNDGELELRRDGLRMS